MIWAVKGYTSGDTGCHWINGNLQANNSRYFEGDATVQRVWLDLVDFVPGTEHTLTLKYGTTKGGKHAYELSDHLGLVGRLGHPRRSLSGSDRLHNG